MAYKPTMENSQRLQTALESQIITRSFSVPSPGLVSDIIGRKGSKIKALRARTSTHIKTPNVGEDPVFLVTGRPEDVAAAKDEMVAEIENLMKYRARLPQWAKCTQRVPVPTSEHVANIVGKNFWKIKPLQAKAKIKTPARGQDPTFVITGTLQDVDEVRRQLDIDAKHAVQILALEKEKATQNRSIQIPQFSVEEGITIYVRVPIGAAGLIVGANGTRIKRLQQLTNTTIVTPARFSTEPSFSVKGKPEDVARAKREIQSYVAERMGRSVTDSDSDEYNSPSLLVPQSPPRRSVRAPSPRDASMPEGGSSNGAPFDYSPAVTTPTRISGGRQESAATIRFPLSPAAFDALTQSSFFYSPPAGGSTHSCSSYFSEETAVASPEP